MQHFYSSPRSVTAGVRPCPLAMQHFSSFVFQACHWWCPPFAAGHVAFLFFCLPGLSLVCPCLLAMNHFYSFVSQVRPCSISLHLSFRSVTGGVRPFPLGMQHFCSFVSRVCHWCCRPFLLFLFICLPCLSLLISALFRWPCSISIHLSPRLVTGGVRPFPLFLCICLPGLSLLVSALFVGHAAFLFISLPGLSLLVPALFRWRCTISIHLFSRSVTAGVRPFPLGMQHFYSFVSRVFHWCCRPFPLAI